MGDHCGFLRDFTGQASRQCIALWELRRQKSLDLLDLFFFYGIIVPQDTILENASLMPFSKLLSSSNVFGKS